MRKCAKYLLVVLLILTAVWFATVWMDKTELRENVIRLHVVAASDSREDQAVKLEVRDAITESLKTAMVALPDAQAAKGYIRSHLEELEQIANDVLEQAGVSQRATVTLAQEAFDMRQYDTFALPAGIYESLRVTIGTGQGHNWWCVVFPTFCVSATTEEMADTAAGAGFSNGLTGALTGEKTYQVRFFLLDCIGRLEKLLAK